MTDATIAASEHAPGEPTGERGGDEQLLDRAAELVSGGWCQGALARDRHRRPVEPWSDSARRWSPLGAILAGWLRSESPRSDFLSAAGALSCAVGGHVEEWNDKPWRTHAHVLSAFRRAPLWLLEAESTRQGAQLASTLKPGVAGESDLHTRARAGP
jgi:hypothetical protein